MHESKIHNSSIDFNNFSSCLSFGQTFLNVSKNNVFTDFFQRASAVPWLENVHTF